MNYLYVHSEIYCYGDLLHTVQMAKIYPDSKTFVDMKLKTNPETTIAKFRTWQSQNPSPSPDDIRRFVTVSFNPNTIEAKLYLLFYFRIQENFDPPGSEFVKYVPDDYVENPRVLDLIKDPDYRQWAKDLNDLWLLLGRKMTDDVAVSQD